jgi:glycosyltransferase involved in cell wall biosynthesis
LWSPLLYGLRRRLVRDVMASADACVAGSSLVIESLREMGMLGEREVALLPYGVPVADKATSSVEPFVPQLPIRLGFVGSVLPHKGLHVAAAAVRDLPAGTVTFDAWGDAAFDGAYAQRVRNAAGEASLRLRGSFPETARTEVLREMDVLLVPSLGLESFGLVAWEAMHCGVPVIASDRVPLADALRHRDCGAVYPAERTDELTRLLRAVIAEPQTLVRWRANLPAVKGWAEHAREVELLYARALSARRYRRTVVATPSTNAE